MEISRFTLARDHDPRATVKRHWCPDLPWSGSRTRCRTRIPRSPAGRLQCIRVPRDNEMTCKQARAAVVSRPAGCAALLAAGLGLVAFPVLAADPADTILVNGKIVTVDGRFTIAQGVAIRGQRIVAVGATAKILKLKGADTKVIDLLNKTVIPGLIDNHAHFIRAPEHDEMRFDGVTSRKRALAMLAERVRAAKPGEWIVTLGGWSEEQFTDDPRGFPLDELD